MTKRSFVELTDAEIILSPDAARFKLRAALVCLNDAYNRGDAKNFSSGFEPKTIAGLTREEIMKMHKRFFDDAQHLETNLPFNRFIDRYFVTHFDGNSTFQSRKSDNSARPYLLFFNTPTKSWWICKAGASYNPRKVPQNKVVEISDLTHYLQSPFREKSSAYAFPERAIPVSLNMLSSLENGSSEEVDFECEKLLRREFCENNKFLNNITSPFGVHYCSNSYQKVFYAPQMLYIMQFLNFAKNETAYLNIIESYWGTPCFQQYVNLVQESSTLLVSYMKRINKDANQKICFIEQNEEKVLSKAANICGRIIEILDKLSIANLSCFDFDLSFFNQLGFAEKVSEPFRSIIKRYNNPAIENS